MGRGGVGWGVLEDTGTSVPSCPCGSPVPPRGGPSVPMRPPGSLMSLWEPSATSWAPQCPHGNPGVTIRAPQGPCFPVGTPTSPYVPSIPSHPWGPPPKPAWTLGMIPPPPPPPEGCRATNDVTTALLVSPKGGNLSIKAQGPSAAGLLSLSPGGWQEGGTLTGPGGVRGGR